MLNNCTDISRRKVLQGLAGTAIAASAVQTVSPVTASTEPSGVIEGITTSADEVYVDLEAPGAADYVTLIGPTGQEQDTDELSKGETSARFDILSDSIVDRDTYQEAENYTAYAYATNDGDDEEVGNVKMEFEPDVDVIGFEAYRGGIVHLALQNNGTGPVSVRNVRIIEGAPHTEEPGEDGSHYPELIIGPGETVIRQYDSGLSFRPYDMQDEESANEWCGTSHTATFELDISPGDMTESSLEVKLDGPPVEEDVSGPLGGTEYDCPQVIGEEGLVYDN